MRTVSVQQAALSVRQRADLGGQGNAFGSNSNEAITDQEMLTMLNSSMAEWWDLQIAAYGDNYQWSVYNVPVVQGTYLYFLPFDFYKEFGVDFSLDSTGQNWATVRPYSLRDRNQFSFPLQTALAYQGWQNIRWQIQGQQLNFLPQLGPLPGLVRLLYAPACPVLCATLPAQYHPGTSYNQWDLVFVQLSTEVGNPINQVFQALTAGSSTATTGFGAIVIGAGTAKIIYQAVQPNVSVEVVQNTGGSPGVTVTPASGNTPVVITVTTGTDTAAQVAAIVNGNTLAAEYVAAVPGGSGTATGGTATISPWLVPGVVVDNTVTWAYQGPLALFATEIDGINGGDDYVILDTAIKCGVKIEQDVSAMGAQKAALVERFRQMLENRNAGDPMCISGGFGTAEGGPGAGFGFGTGAGGGWGFD